MPKIPKSRKDELIQKVKEHILSKTKPQNVFFFGSISTELFDSASDIDVLLVFENQQQADFARRTLYGKSQPPNDVLHALEFICIDRITFDSKSKVGGICFVALHEGIIAYP